MRKRGERERERERDEREREKGVREREREKGEEKNTIISSGILIKMIPFICGWI